MRVSLTVAVAATALAALAGAATTSASPSRRVATETFFRCESGWSFEVHNNTAAHCERGGTLVTAPLNPCANVGGVGLFASTDRVGTKDMCTGTNPVTGEISVERGCPLGYTKRIVTGVDRCEQTLPKEFRAPSVAVDRES